MTITLHMACDAPPMSWSDFRSAASPRSIALDGVVADGPRFDPEGPHINFNHHECVSRLETRATCAQVLMAIRQGLFSTFQSEGIPDATVWVNDCDQDVCTSWFLCNNSHLVTSTMNPLVNRLVSMEDALDTTAGAYPFPSSLPVLSELAWVFEPYTQFRMNGGLHTKRQDAFTSVVTDVELRIRAHIAGQGKSIPIDTRYEVRGGGQGWSLVQEIGAQARTAMFAEGITAFCAIMPHESEKRWRYSIGRMSILIPFNVPAILEALNKEEGCMTDRWGGGNTIGGSPRVNGSELTPQDVTRVINAVLAHA